MAADKPGYAFPFADGNGKTHTVSQLLSFPRNNQRPGRLSHDRRRESESRGGVAARQAWMLDTSFFLVPCPSQSLDDDAVRSVDATDDGGWDTQPGRGCVGTRTADEAPVPLTTKEIVQLCQTHSCTKLTLPVVVNSIATTF